MMEQLYTHLECAARCFRADPYTVGMVEKRVAILQLEDSQR